VSVYRWDLPEDVRPLRDAIQALSMGAVDVVLFTSGVQAAHLFLVATELGLADAVRDELHRAVVASIGPTTSEELRRQGAPPDLEASRPRSGVLVREAAESAREILRRKSQ
jgi:uroporphyrinogen-III synthase